MEWTAKGASLLDGSIEYGTYKTVKATYKTVKATYKTVKATYKTVKARHIRQSMPDGRGREGEPRMARL